MEDNSNNHDIGITTTTIDANNTTMPIEEQQRDYTLSLVDSGVFENQIIITKVISFLSAMGSAYIITSLIRKARRRRRQQNNDDDRKISSSRTFDRLLSCLCISDLISSTSLFLSSWLVPAHPPIGYEEATGVEGDWDYMFPQAIGNTATCTVQGLFLYIGVCASVLFTGCIAISFLLQIKFQYNTRQMQIAEKYFLGISIVIPILASIIILIDEGFNPIAKGFCYVFISPMICLRMFQRPESSQEDTIESYCNSNNTQIRGKNSELYSVILYFGPVMVVLLIILTCMITIFWTVRRQELNSARWSISGIKSSSSNRKKRYRRRVLVRGMLYVSAFLGVWIPYIVGLSLYDTNPVIVHYIGSFVLPLQGVLNVLIYSDIFNLFKESATNVTNSIRTSIKFGRGVTATRNNTNSTTDKTPIGNGDICIITQQHQQEQSHDYEEDVTQDITQREAQDCLDESTEEEYFRQRSIIISATMEERNL